MNAVRLAEPVDIENLAAVERAAARKFHLEWTGKSTAGDQTRTLPREILESALAQGSLWLATEGDAVVGFLAARILGDALHIDEVSVAYDHQGQGHGRNLMMTAISEAKARLCEAVTLTTDRLIPWNGPFYSRLGFQEVSFAACPPDLAVILANEKSHAGNPENRIAMRLYISSSLRGA